MEGTLRARRQIKRDDRTDDSGSAKNAMPARKLSAAVSSLQSRMLVEATRSMIADFERHGEFASAAALTSPDRAGK